MSECNQRDQGDQQSRDFGVKLVGVVQKRPGNRHDSGGQQCRPELDPKSRQVKKGQRDAQTGQQRHEQRRGQTRVLPFLQTPPVGRHEGDGEADGMH